MPRLAHARNDHAAGAGVDQLRGVDEAAVVAQARVQRNDGIGLDRKGLATQFQHALRQGFVKTFQHYLVISYTHSRSINELRKQKTCQS